MDGASKFVRGDAIAGLIITVINIVGGIIIGYFRHGMDMGEAADVFIKLSVGDGLVTQIPALIVSLAAGLLVSKGGTRGSADKAVFGQLGAYPRALYVAGALLLSAGDHAGPAVRSRSSRLPAPWPPSATSSRSAATQRAGGRRASKKQAEASKADEDEELGQGVAGDRRDRASASASSCRPSCSSRIRNWPSAWARCARSSPPSTASSCPKSGSPTISPSRPRATRSRSTAPSSPSTRCASARSWCCSATAKRRTSRARKCASRPSACAPCRCPKCSPRT